MTPTPRPSPTLPSRPVTARSALVAGLVTMFASIAVVVAPIGADVVHAAESAPSRFVPVDPCRLLDTRGGQAVVAGGEIELEVGGRCVVPEGATAAALAVTAVAPSALGFVTVWPGDEPRPVTSVVNYRAGQVVPNAQLVRLDGDGDIRLYTSARAHLVVDVTGYFVPADGAVRSGRYVAVEQQRLVDTRESGRPPRGGVVTIEPDVPDGSVAVAVNIATTQSSGPGFFTAYAEGADRPTASVLNTDGSGQTRAAAAVVPLSDGGFDIYTQLGDHVLVDIVGYFTGDDAPRRTEGLFVAATPERLVDTRRDWGSSGGPRLWAGGGREFAVTGITGGPVAAIAANITMTSTEDAGYVVAGPARVERDTTSSVNAGHAQMTVANAAIVEVSTAGVAFESLDATHLVVDITGWFTGAPVEATGDEPVNTAPSDRRVVIISDSAMAGVRWNGALGGLQGFDAVPLLESCRRLVQWSCRGREGYAPLTAYAEILEQPTAGPDDILVVAVGYNDWHSRFSADFDQVIAAARARQFRHVAWVTFRSRVGYTLPGTGGSQSNYGTMNQILQEKVASGAFPEVRLWDLDEYTWPTPSGWFASDGVHETELGSFGVADWLSRHVRAFDDRPCVHPWAAGGKTANPCPTPDPLPDTDGYPDIAGLYDL